MSKRIFSTLKLGLFFLLALLVSINITPVFAVVGTPPKINWLPGPQVITMGQELSKLNLPEGYEFAGAEDTYNLMKYIGNTPSKADIGVVLPNTEKKDWFVVFSYDPIGYVKDEDADSIDKDGILKTITEATEEANKQRQAQNVAPLHVTGWHEAPHYEATTHNLVWAIAATDSDGNIVNYNTRKLGRYGVTSINLVIAPEKLATVKPELEKLIANYNYVPGKQYTDFNPSQDKVADIGLAALIAGGVGATAVKTGIFGKILLILAAVLKKLWILAIAGLGFLKSKFGGKKPEVTAETKPPES
jgi:uncharacterized membrane-anchored protein